MPLQHDDTAIERWAAPPPNARRGRTALDLDPVINTLRRRPRTWALVWNNASPYQATRLRKASPNIEVRTLPTDDPKRRDVYARYIPKAVEAVS